MRRSKGYRFRMGFHATEVCELPARARHHRARLSAKPTPSRKNRVWDFFATYATSARVLPSQPAETVSETSTALTISVSGVCYYVHRYYEPPTGRWLNRDTIEEDGGINLYVVCNNDCANAFDVLGETVDYVQKPTDFNGNMKKPGYTTLWPYEMKTQKETQGELCRLTSLKISGWTQIHIKKDYNSNAPRRRPWGGSRSTLVHETVHVLIYKTNLYSLDASVSKYMNLWACCACTEARLAYINEWRNAFWYSQAEQQNDFDIHDYQSGVEQADVIASKANNHALLRESLENLIDDGLQMDAACGGR
jgi:RHS repeat-associated protein